MTACYVDTSALAKRYIHERRSDDVDSFLAEQDLLLITSLTTVEMRSLLARRRRMQEIVAALEMQIFASFLDDVRQGYLVEHELSTSALEGAVNLIAQVPAVPLRTLDAMHLAAAQQLGAERFATADEVMRDAAGELGIEACYFG